MINLNNKVNKSLSLAAKLMTLALAFAAVSCDKCDDKTKEAEAQDYNFDISFKPESIKTDVKSAKIVIKNKSKVDFDAKDSKVTLTLNAVTGKSDADSPKNLLEDHKAIKVGSEEHDGKAEKTFDLEKLLTKKITAEKEEEINFEFKKLVSTGNNSDKDVEAEVTATLKWKDKEGKDQEAKKTLKWTLA